MILINNIASSKTRLMRLVLMLLLGIANTANASSASDETAVVSPLSVDGLSNPRLILFGRLGNTLKIIGCEFISGLTCKIALVKGQELPSQIFFVELGPRGERLGKEIRLIYPKLLPGEQGSATFRTIAKGPQILLLGEWKGPWNDPY